MGSTYYYPRRSDRNLLDSVRWHLINENLEYLSRFSDTPQNYFRLQSLVGSLVGEDTLGRGVSMPFFHHLNRYMRWDGRYTREVWRSPGEIYKSNVVPVLISISCCWRCSASLVWQPAISALLRHLITRPTFLKTLSESVQPCDRTHI